MRTSFHWDNLTYAGMGPARNAQGKLVFVLPMADEKLPGIAVEDVGKCAYGIFKDGGKFIGQTVGVAGEHLTGAEMAEALSLALEQPISYEYVQPEVYRTFPFPAAEDIGNMFQYKRDFSAEYRAARDPAFARALNPELLTFAAWLTRNKHRVILPAK